MNLKGKKILLIGPPNYNYPLTVKKQLEKFGCEVHFYDERNNPTAIQKIILRKAPFLMSKSISRYYDSILKNEDSFDPDYVLFISPESVTSHIVEKMKKVFSRGVFILYMWDSIENKNAKNIYHLFDKCLSFDRNDCKKYKFIFRPLFYTNLIKECKENVENNFRFDYGFIGTTHSDRPKTLYLLKKFCEKNALTYFIYLFVPSRIMIVYYFICNKYFRQLYKAGLVHSKTIDRLTVEKTMSQTNCVVDVNHPHQIGLTMRTIEMLGLGKKLLTTNSDIVNYDFFNPNNIHVVDRRNPQFNTSFLNMSYEAIPEDVFNRYSIEQWTRDVMN